MSFYTENECDYQIIKLEKINEEKLDCSFDDVETQAESNFDHQENEQVFVNYQGRMATNEQVYWMDMLWLNSFPMHSRQLIGEAILASVYRIVPNYGLALKITGMLIDLPENEMSHFLKDYNILFFRV